MGIMLVNPEFGLITVVSEAKLENERITEALNKRFGIRGLENIFKSPDLICFYSSYVKDGAAQCPTSYRKTFCT